MDTFRVIVTVALLGGLLYALWRQDPFPLDSAGSLTTYAAIRVG
jgi:hypothetical protein